MSVDRLRIALLLLVVGCQGPSEPSAPRAIEASLNAGVGIVASATGGGIIDFSGPGLSDGVFSFSAMRLADGSALGHFRQYRERNGLIVEFSGRVTCVTFDATLRRARIGGVITANGSTDPAFLTVNHEVGDDVWFRVEDGGEGKGATDLSTSYGFKPTLVNTSAEYCALPFTGLPWWNPASIFPLKGGNIQVRP